MGQSWQNESRLDKYVTLDKRDTYKELVDT